MDQTDELCFDTVKKGYRIQYSLVLPSCVTLHLASRNMPSVGRESIMVVFPEVSSGSKI